MREIALNAEPQEDKLKKPVLALIFVIVVASVAIAAGFIFGKSNQAEKFLSSGNVSTKSAAPAGWQLLDEKGFSIAYPKAWEAKENSAGEPPGAKIKSEGGKVELWLRLEQPYLFSEEQKGKQTGKKEEKIKVDGREGTITEFTYDTGGYYMIIEVAATLIQPKVTFWTNAGNDDYKKTVLDIIGSFQSKSGSSETK